VNTFHVGKRLFFKPMNVVQNENVELRLRSEAPFIFDVRDTYLSNKLKAAYGSR
jgi:hypothetical protein